MCDPRARARNIRALYLLALIGGAFVGGGLWRAGAASRGGGGSQGSRGTEVVLWLSVGLRVGVLVWVAVVNGPAARPKESAAGQV